MQLKMALLKLFVVSYFQKKMKCFLIASSCRAQLLTVIGKKSLQYSPVQTFYDYYCFKYPLQSKPLTDYL